MGDDIKVKSALRMHPNQETSIFRKRKHNGIRCVAAGVKADAYGVMPLKDGIGGRRRRPVGFRGFTVLVAVWAAAVLSGCQSPAAYRKASDKTALKIVHEKQSEALGHTEPFSIEKPSDTLRRKLLSSRNLPHAGPAAVGSDRLPKSAHWPETEPLSTHQSTHPNGDLPGDGPLCLSLGQALQVAAKNNGDYQEQKENIFRAALALDLERDVFHNTFLGQVAFLLETDRTGAETVSGTQAGTSASWTRKLAGGAELSGALAIDLANLLTMGGASALGQIADATVSIPLLRGSARHIVQESLNQAERDVVYAIYGFERFKRNFAVDIAEAYLAVLRQMDATENAAGNYRSLIASARRARRLADAGRLPEIQVDQAVQNELRARDRWIASTQRFEDLLDAFKAQLGLPPDARVALDRNDLQQLREQARNTIAAMHSASDMDGHTPSSGDRIVLQQPSAKGAGPLEMTPEAAIRLALDNRLDLRATVGAVFDARRRVVVAADALRAELTIIGSATVGESRSIDSAALQDASLRFNQGQYGALLTLDLPFERTEERNAYRESFIDLEAAIRDVQALEDRIKLSIQTALRSLRTARESLSVQAKAVAVAQKRVRSINLFLEAGRAELRDLLEAQEALFSAQNALTAAVIDYRIAGLRLQADMGLLAVDEKGRWQEYALKGVANDAHRKP